MYIPDNYDLFLMNEAEIERTNKKHINHQINENMEDIEDDSLRIDRTV